MSIPVSYREYCALLYSISINLKALYRRKTRATTPVYETRMTSSVEDTIDWEL